MKPSIDYPNTVSRLRCLVGLLAGVLLTLSSTAHALAGWPPQQAALTAAQVPMEVIANLSIGWHFGGVTMLAFGVITLFVFVQAWRGRAVSLWPVTIIAVTYIAFGAWAWAVSGSAGFAVFVVLGLLLAVAAWPVLGKSAP